MGICCTRQKKSKIFNTDPSNATQQFEKIVTPTLLRTLKVDSPFNHCNILIWSPIPSEFPSLFPQTFHRYQVSQLKEMTFNISSFYTYKTESPFAIDALVFFLSNPSDFQLCKEISNSYPTICIKAIISQTELEDYTGFIKIPTKELLWLELHKHQENLAKMLRELFTDIDTDFSNFVSFEEFFAALLQLDPSCSLETARGIWKEIDKDKDGKVSLNEFCYWWKRGRQGKASIVELTSNWADRIMYMLPKMSGFTENREIDKSRICKRLSIKSVSESEPMFAMKILAGKSGKREEILHTVEKQLGLNIYEFWVTCGITAESEEKAKMHLQLFRDTLVNLQACVFSNSSSVECCDMLNVETYRRGEKIFMLMLFDVESKGLVEIIKKLDQIEEKLTSPIDDFISITFKSDFGIKDMLSMAQNQFIESLRFGSLEVVSEHWSAYSSMISAESDLEFLQQFIKLEGESLINPEELPKIAPIHEYIKQFFSPFNQVLTQMHILQEALKVFEEDFRPSLSFYFRYMSLGFEVTLEGEDLLTLIIN